MYRFAKDGRVRWPVKVEQLQPDGSVAEQTFGVVYQVMTRQELEARDMEIAEYIRQSRALLPTDGADDTSDAALQRQQLAASRAKADDALLRERVKGWTDIVDQDDTPIAYSAETLAAFVGDELMRSTLLRGLLDASNGARSKNSRPGLAGLPVPAQA